MNSCIGRLLYSRLWAWNGLLLNTYITMYAITNRCYNKRGSTTNYVRSSIFQRVSITSKNKQTYSVNQLSQVSFGPLKINKQCICRVILQKKKKLLTFHTIIRKETKPFFHFPSKQYPSTYKPPLRHRCGRIRYV